MRMNGGWVEGNGPTLDPPKAPIGLVGSADDSYFVRR
jgi:hypothetical protein